MNLDAGTVVALVVAVSFAAGLNVYATILTLGALTRMHWVTLPPGLHALSDVWVLVASGVLFAAEFVADKIPGLDVVWSAAHTLIRIPLAALMAFAATSQLSPELRALATVLGGALAMVAHSSKTAARVLVTPSPEPISNIALSSAEDLGAIALTWVATRHPLAAAAVAAGLTVGAVVLVRLAAAALLRMGRTAGQRAAGAFRRTAAILK